MKNRLKSAVRIMAVGAGLLLVSSLAQAQLITVNTGGRFNNPSPGGQASDEFSPPANTFGSVASFRTGVLTDPVNHTLKTGATFQGIQAGFEQSYTLGAAPVTFAVGNWILANGITNDGTTEDRINFDFQLNFVNLGLALVPAPFVITLDGAPGKPDNVYTVTAPPGGSIVVGGNTYNYVFNLPFTSTTVVEDGVVTSDFSITFTAASTTPVPEPSTYGLIGAAVLAVGVFVRRRLDRRADMALPA